MDTDVRECMKCGYETDCIEGICLNCTLGETIMTADEAIYKMMVQVLKNQMALLGGLSEPEMALLKVGAELVVETDELLEQVMEK